MSSSQLIDKCMKKLVQLFYIAVVAALCACSGVKSEDALPTIAVSIEPQRQILESLAGDDYNVVSILSRGANPETFEPSMSQRAATASCRAYITTGAFPFEKTIAETLGDDGKVYDCSRGIKKIYGTHSHHHDNDAHSDEGEGEADPHIWTSTVNALIMARNMAEVLSELNPANKAIYQSRLDSLGKVIEALEIQITDKISNADSKAFAIWHPSLSYFARDFGLHQISVGQESKEISPRHLREIIEEATEDSVHVFFFQKEFDSRQAASINERIGSRLIVIDPLAYDWMAELTHIADELSDNR